MFALVFNNSVAQISEQQFPVAKELSWVDLGVNPHNVAAGFNYDGTNFTAPPILSTPTAQQMRNMSYPTLPQFLEMLYSSMQNKEIPSCSAFCTVMQTVQTNHPLPIDVAIKL